MAKKNKNLSFDMEVKEIKDGSKYYTKEEEVKEMRIVILKDEDNGATLTINTEKSEHPLEYLRKLTDIGLEATLELTIGENPQKTLDDIPT